MRVTKQGNSELYDNLHGVADPDRKAIRLLFTQVVNEAITRDASRVLLSDGRLWLVCRRLVDTFTDDVKPKRCFIF